jgi:hypothetical protein
MIPDDPPHLATDPALSDVLQELKAREPIFHRPEFGTKRADFEHMTVEDFWEVGASGRRYSRNEVLDVLERGFSTPHEDVWKADDFHCQKLSADVFLLTYTLTQDGTRRTRRETIWQRSAGRWKIVYHTGTIILEI